MKRLICKVFGHKVVETSFREWRGKGRNRKRKRVFVQHCARCGVILK